MAGGWDKVNYSKTPEERRASAMKAAAASAEVRKQRRLWKDSVEMIMAGKLDEERAAAVVDRFSLDCKPEDLTQQDQVIAALADKAQRGDRDAAAFLRDTAGQAPAQMVKVGNLDGPFEKIDLASLSDEDLRKLAERENPD